MAATNEGILTKMAEAFNKLADDVNSHSTPTKVAEAFNELADDVNSRSTPTKVAEAFNELADDVNSRSTPTKMAEAFNELADDVNSRSTPTKMAEAFNELADDVNSRSTQPRLSLSKFCLACRLLSPLIGCMGIAFRFADIDFNAKLDGLTKALESIDTIEALIDLDIAHDFGKDSGSKSRDLIRVNRSVDMARIICEQILAQRGNFITGPVLTAYEQVFAPYHSLAIKTAVHASALTLPTKARLLRKLNENEASANVQMQKFVIASSAVVQYINNLFHSTENGDELLGMI